MWLEKAEVEKYKKLDKWNNHINCGGYALHVDGWYEIGSDINWWNNETSKATRTGEWRKLERKCVRHILNDNPELKLVSRRMIDNVEVNLDKYEIVAFRISRNWFGSYHFMRCEPNGDWTEKCGSRTTVYRHPYEDIYDIWGDMDGRIYFFIRPRN